MSRCYLLLALIIGPAVCAQAPQGELVGRFSLGVRGVDVDGSKTKYREDVNLDDGPRIFDIGVTFAPADADRAVDRIDFDLSSFGSEPYETMSFEARKYGTYKFELDHRRSEYFYEDTILPIDLASVEGATGGDFHHFDFERVTDTARLDIDVAPATRLNVDLERFTKQGLSTTTLDIQRDEFELERPIDESFGGFTVGVEHDWDKLTLIAEQRIGDYENATDLFLPGFSRGANLDDSAELEVFNATQPYDYESASTAFRLLARPSERLVIQGGWRREGLDLDMEAAETAAGTTFTGDPFMSDLTGRAVIDRDIDLVDLALGYSLGERFLISVSAKDMSLEQEGDLVFGADIGASTWLIDTTGLEARLEVALTPTLVLATGWSTEERDVDRRQDLALDPASHAETTQRDGFFVSLSFDPTGPLSLTASVEDNSIDDPFTLSAPSQGRRIRVQGRYRWQNGLALNASYRRNDLENDLSGWTGDTDQTDLRMSYANESLSLSAGYGQVEYARRIDQAVTGGSRVDLFAIAYGADADFVDASLRWQVATKVAAGAYARRYDNSGSYALERDDGRAFVEVALRDNYVLQLAKRSIDYDEDGFDDFSAELVELALGYRW